MSKTIGTNPEVQFLYDKLNPVQELNGSNGVVANLLTGLRVDEYFTRTDTATSSFLTDALGSTIGMVGTGSTIATNYTYQPFGATTIGGSANGNSYEFTGRENDGNGLFFYRTRFYSPSFQRFISQDPIGFAGGTVNLYGYVRNSPINRIDPFGLVDLNLIPKGDPLHAVEDQYNPTNVYSVAAHGDESGFYGPDGNLIPIGQLANMIKSDPHYAPGEGVYVDACSVGKGGSNSPAQQLANALGAPVTAPNSDENIRYDQTGAQGQPLPNTFGFKDNGGPVTFLPQPPRP